MQHDPTDPDRATAGIPPFDWETQDAEQASAAAYDAGFEAGYTRGFNFGSRMLALLVKDEGSGD